MISVSVVSDLHLETGPCELPGGDVLILAGDACEARRLQALTNSPRPATGEVRNPILKFFEIECAKYQRVLYLPGNHEHYNGIFESTVDILKSCVPSTVTVLDRGYEIINDTVFVLATLWTDMNGADPITLMRVRDYMTDFFCIHTQAGGRFTTARAVLEFEKSRDYISDIAAQFPDRNIVVCTHHAPSDLSTAERYRGQYHENGGYRSKLEDFILDRPNIKWWSHGHMHNFSDYKIGDCRVICNPRGYLGHDARNSGFQPDFKFEI
jgi:hypothetical protein